MSGAATARRWRRFAIFGAIALVLGHLLDRAAFEHFFFDTGEDPESSIPDWRRNVRIAGYVPFWWIVALALGLCATGRRRWRGPLLLALAPLVAVVCAELLKFLIRRERPKYHGGDYVFRPWDGELTTSGLGLPSSHTVTAFAACYVLLKLHPRGAPLWWVMACACGLSRIATHAHFLSDVVAAAVLAWPIVEWLDGRLRREERSVSVAAGSGQRPAQP